jgi:hypothetical protein
MFVQPDWWEVTEKGVGTNRFSYSLNDPVNLTDPGGNVPLLGILGCAGGGCEALAAGIGGAIAGLFALDAADGKIDGRLDPSSIEPFDFGQEAVEPDSGPQGIALGNPMGDLDGGYQEGYTIDADPGPAVLADPFGDDYSGALDGRILSTTPGTYEIHVVKGGKEYVYVGKGDEARMRESIRRHTREGYEVVGSKWEQSKDHRSAYKDEDRKMQKYGGDQRSKSNELTNKIDSPGKKYREEDDD